jgi:hypothetical protein
MRAGFFDMRRAVRVREDEVGVVLSAVMMLGKRELAVARLASAFEARPRDRTAANPAAGVQLRRVSWRRSRSMARSSRFWAASTLMEREVAISRMLKER